MENKEIILQCNKAIKMGFGNYFVCPNLTWRELKEGLEEGKIWHPQTEQNIGYAMSTLQVLEIAVLTGGKGK